MKEVKTSIGTIAFLKTEKNLKESTEMIPKGWRVMHIWELTKIYHTETEKLKDFDLEDYFIIDTKDGCLAGVLSSFNFNSGIYFSNRNVDDNGRRLRGVCLVKQQKVND